MTRWVYWCIVLAIIYMLVRPGSPAREAIAILSGTTAAMLRAVVGTQGGSSS